MPWAPSSVLGVIVVKEVGDHSISTQLLVLLFGHLIPCCDSFIGRVSNPEGMTLWFSRRGLQTTLKS